MKQYNYMTQFLSYALHSFVMQPWKNPPFCIVTAPILPQDRPPSVPTDSKGKNSNILTFYTEENWLYIFLFFTQVQN
jgi:hypothetical protein